LLFFVHILQGGGIFAFLLNYGDLIGAFYRRELQDFSVLKGQNGWLLKPERRQALMPRL